MEYQRNISSRFSRDSGAIASELLENHEELFPGQMKYPSDLFNTVDSV